MGNARGIAPGMWDLVQQAVAARETRIGQQSEDSAGEHSVCRVFPGRPLQGILVDARAEFMLQDVNGDVSDIHAVAKYALGSTQRCELGCLPAGGAMHIYTDGSHRAEGGSSHAGWSFVVLHCSTEGDVRLLGCLWHGERDDEHSWLSRPDSNAMELLAILWATAWVVAQGLSRPVVVHTDSLVALHAVQALWSCKSHAGVATQCAALVLLARQLGSLSFEHVEAHQLHPWNELADSLAKRAAGGASLPLPQPVGEAISPAATSVWEWLRAASVQERAAYPPLSEGAWIFTERRSQAVADKLGPDISSCGGVSAVDGCPGTQTEARVKFGTYNALTLAERVAGRQSRWHRSALLRGQMREAGVHFLGLQESRGLRGRSEIDGCLAISSACLNGQYGCDLWVDLARPYFVERGRKLTFRDKDFVVIQENPRLLLVRVCARRFSCTIAVAHAPHSARPVAERKAWWKELTSALGGHSDPVLLIDANGRVGTECSTAVGSGGFAQEQDDNGRRLHELVLEKGLCLPSTFGPYDPQQYTWVGAAGHRHRIDYVAVPIAWGLPQLNARPAIRCSRRAGVALRCQTLGLRTWIAARMEGRLTSTGARMTISWSRSSSV